MRELVALMWFAFSFWAIGSCAAFGLLAIPALIIVVPIVSGILAILSDHASKK